MGNANPARAAAILDLQRPDAGAVESGGETAMTEAMRWNERFSAGTTPPRQTAGAGARQEFAPPLNQGDGADTAALSGAVTAHEDRLDNDRSSGSTEMAPIPFACEVPSAPRRREHRMRWPGDTDWHGLDAAGTWAGDESPVQAAAGLVLPTQRRASFADGMGMLPGPGEADLDVPDWWLEERARVVAKDLDHRARAARPT